MGRLDTLNPSDFDGVGWECVDRALARLDPENEATGVDLGQYSLVEGLLGGDGRGWEFLNPHHVVEMLADGGFDRPGEERALPLINLVMQTALTISRE